MNGRSSRWVVMWRFKEWLVENDCEQTRHWNGLVPEMQFFLHDNHLISQQTNKLTCPWQRYGALPVWRARWAFKMLKLEKDFPHCVHEYGFSPARNSKSRYFCRIRGDYLRCANGQPDPGCHCWRQSTKQKRTPSVPDDSKSICWQNQIMHESVTVAVRCTG